MAGQSLESFSVIVICYKRKNFLLDAVKSVLSQDYPRDKIQIIVVKAFYDDEVDSFLKENDIHAVFSDTDYYGRSVADALTAATGNIVCLLDDDDIFYSNKLSKVSQIFQTDEGIYLSVNNYNIIDKNGAVIESNFHEAERENQFKLGLRVLHPDDYDLNIMLNALRMTFNSSRMCFRRGIIANRLDLVSRISYLVDVIPIVLCLNDGRSVVSMTEELTGYRIHENNISLAPSVPMDVKRLAVVHIKIMDDAAVLSEYFSGINESLSRVYSFFLSSQKYKLALLKGDRRGAVVASKDVLIKLFENPRELWKYRGLLITLPGSIFNIAFMPLIILSPRLGRKLRLIFPI